ncbi:hypothetical protein QYF36_001938 [Acer negundo]|nr:hypothetical protein QYF36_001938 [Acer negundo]
MGKGKEALDHSAEKTWVRKSKDYNSGEIGEKQIAVNGKKRKCEFIDKGRGSRERNRMRRSTKGILMDGYEDGIGKQGKAWVSHVYVPQVVLLYQKVHRLWWERIASRRPARAISPPFASLDEGSRKSGSAAFTLFKGVLNLKSS